MNTPSSAKIIGRSFVAALCLAPLFWLIFLWDAPAHVYGAFFVQIAAFILLILRVPFGLAGLLIGSLGAFRHAGRADGDRLALVLLSLTVLAALVCGVLLVNLWNSDHAFVVAIYSQYNSFTYSYPTIPPQLESHWWLTGWSLTLAVVAVPLATLAYGIFWRSRLTLRIALSVILASSVALSVVSWATSPAGASVAQPSGGPPQMFVQQGTSPKTNCSQGVYPPITVANAGGGTLLWTASADSSSPVTITPSSGSLGPGQQQTVTLSGVLDPKSTHGAYVNFQAHTASDPSGDYGDQSVFYGC
jgi:hypothetical protein